MEEISQHLKEPIKGIVHLGANRCQEHKDYLKYVPSNKIFWVEAIPSIVQDMKTLDQSIQIYQALLTERDGDEMQFNISSNDGQSSSILDFHYHAMILPSITMVDKITLKSSRFDTLVKNGTIPIEDSNVLVLDLQGAELGALKGVGDYLKQFDAIFSEINIAETYKGCTLLNELEAYLGGFGFYRHRIKMWPANTFGDGTYFKRSAVKPDSVPCDIVTYYIPGQ